MNRPRAVQVFDGDDAPQILQLPRIGWDTFAWLRKRSEFSDDGGRQCAMVLNGLQELNKFDRCEISSQQESVAESLTKLREAVAPWREAMEGCKLDENAACGDGISGMERYVAAIDRTLTILGRPWREPEPGMRMDYDLLNGVETLTIQAVHELYRVRIPRENTFDDWRWRRCLMVSLQDPRPEDLTKLLSTNKTHQLRELRLEAPWRNITTVIGYPVLCLVQRMHDVGYGSRLRIFLAHSRTLYGIRNKKRYQPEMKVEEVAQFQTDVFIKTLRGLRGEA